VPSVWPSVSLGRNLRRQSRRPSRAGCYPPLARSSSKFSTNGDIDCTVFSISSRSPKSPQPWLYLSYKKYVGGFFLSFCASVQLYCICRRAAGCGIQLCLELYSTFIKARVYSTCRQWKLGAQPHIPIYTSITQLLAGLGLISEFGSRMCYPLSPAVFF
jgi:hypothetical protein